MCKVRGILEIIVKKRTKVEIEKEQFYMGMTSLVGLDESFEYNMGLFADILARAVDIINYKNGT